MIQPIAVIINDIHYNLETLSLANKALKQAVDKANDLSVPLIIAGDLHDTKANLRAECITAILNTLKECELQPIVIPGNHDKINEKSTEDALSFLNDTAFVVREPRSFDVELDHYSGYLAHLIPYQNDTNKLRQYLESLKHGSRLIIHQGVTGSNMGTYIRDATAISKEYFKNFRTISGHYHTRQEIVCGPVRDNQVGLFTYTGNPFTLSYGEANDPEKGFHVLRSNGTLEFIPTNIRKHIVIECTADHITAPIMPNDLVWLKIKGLRSQLAKISKLNYPSNYKIDLIPTDKVEITNGIQHLSQDLRLDSIIDSTDTDEDTKNRLKALWRRLV